jgi:hypothetical protein
MSLPDLFSTAVNSAITPQDVGRVFDLAGVRVGLLPG